MDWFPIELEELLDLSDRELARCAERERKFFEEVRITPAKWRLSPWGDLGGGFWSLAVYEDRVLWYNDIEDGFNVSTFQEAGRISADQYWCNQDELKVALPLLRGGGGPRLGPPEPVDG